MKIHLWILLFIILAGFISTCIADSLNPISDSLMIQIAQENTIGNNDSIAVSSPGTESVDSNFIYPMPPERKALLISYSQFNNRWRFIEFFVDIALLALVLFTGLSSKFREWARNLVKREFLAVLFYLLFFMIFIYAISFPFDYYREYIIEHEYGFSNQTFGDWFGDTLKSLAVGFVFGVPVVWILYWLIKRFKKWWLFFAVGSIPFIAFMMLIVPVVVSPLFNKFEPIKDQNLAHEMVALAERAGIHNPDVFEVDASKQSSKVNAYFTGLFGTKRIVLYDTTIKNFTVNELKFIMGHEIGHYLMHHIWYGLFMAVIFIFIAGFLTDKFMGGIINKQSRRFGFSSLGDVASFPLVMLFITLFGFVFQPFSNGVSRYFEYQSDKFGLELSGVNGDEAATAFDKLSVFNLSDPEPSAIIEFWFYDHPALIKRMENVKKLYAQTK